MSYCEIKSGLFPNNGEIKFIEINKKKNVDYFILFLYQYFNLPKAAIKPPLNPFFKELPITNITSTPGEIVSNVTINVYETNFSGEILSNHMILS